MNRCDLPALEEFPENGNRFFLGGHRQARTSQLLHEAGEGHELEKVGDESEDALA